MKTQPGENSRPQAVVLTSAKPTIEPRIGQVPRMPVAVMRSWAGNQIAESSAGAELRMGPPQPLMTEEACRQSSRSGRDASTAGTSDGTQRMAGPAVASTASSRAVERVPRVE